MISEIPLIIFDELVRKGVRMRKIVVVPHENHWSEKFQMEAKRLKSAMPETVKFIILEVRQFPDWQLNLLLI